MPRVPWIVRLSLSGLVVALLLALVPVRDIWNAIRAVPVTLWGLTVLLFLLGHVVAALKWRLLIAGRQHLAPRVWLSAHFAGLLANLCLPGIAGGDVLRGGWVVRQGGSGPDLAVAGLADRAIDTTALLSLSVLGLFATRQLTGPAARAATIAGGGVLALTGLAAAAVLYSRRRDRRGIAGRILEAVRLLAARPGALAAAFGLSLIVQTIFVGLNARLGGAAGVDVPFGAWLAAWPLAKLIALIPASLGGLGVREGALTALMRSFGAPPAAVLAAAVLWDSVLVAGSLAGWAVTAAWRSASPATNRESVSL